MGATLGLEWLGVGLHGAAYDADAGAPRSVEMERIKDGIKEVHFMPFDPTGKRTQVTYQESDGKLMRVTKGAPQIILDLCLDKDDPKYAAAEKDIDDFARKGCVHPIRFPCHIRKGRAVPSYDSPNLLSCGSGTSAPPS